MRTKTIVIFVVFVLLFPTLLKSDQSQGVFRSESELGGKRYTSVVLLKDLSTAPKWNSADDWPPLKPRVAADSAKNAVGKIAPHIKWSVHEFSLVRVGEPGDWIYIVELKTVSETITSDGFRDSFKVVVLLDGRAIVPVTER